MSKQIKNTADSKAENAPGELAADDASSTRPIRYLFLLAALWMPLGFFFWFKLAALFVMPVTLITDVLLGWSLGSDFDQLFRSGYILEVGTFIPVDQLQDGRRGFLAWDINPMIYGWGIPLVFGLIMATPLTAIRRLKQIAWSIVVLTLVQVWGVFWEAHKDLHFNFAHYAASAADATPFSPFIAGLGYQFGALVFPAVAPIILWVAMNFDYVSQLAGRLQMSEHFKR